VGGASVAVVLVTTLVACLGIGIAARSRRPSSRGPRVLRRVAAAATLLVAALAAGPAWRDSGTFALVLVGIPVLCAAAVLAADRTGRRTAAVTGVAAVVLGAWALVTALGLGGWFLAPAAVMVAAAVASSGRSSPSPRAAGGA
jgi:hypothetical protein